MKGAERQNTVNFILIFLFVIVIAHGIENVAYEQPEQECYIVAECQEMVGWAAIWCEAEKGCYKEQLTDGPYGVARVCITHKICGENK